MCTERVHIGLRARLRLLAGVSECLSGLQHITVDTTAQATANVLTVLYKRESVSKPIWSHCAGLSRTAEYNKIQITRRQKYEPSVEHWADD